MNFLSFSVVVCALGVGTGQWCLNLKKETETLIEGDREVRNWAQKSVRSIERILTQNRTLDAMEAVCEGAAIVTPSVVTKIRTVSQALARAQDFEWKALQTSLSLGNLHRHSEFSGSRRGVSRLCTPGRFGWDSSTLVILRGIEEGIRIKLSRHNAPEWRFENPNVVRRLR